MFLSHIVDRIEILNLNWLKFFNIFLNIIKFLLKAFLLLDDLSDEDREYYIALENKN